MAYQKQTWREYDDTKTELQNINNGAVATPERLNHIENGIANSADKAEVTAQLQQKVGGGVLATANDLNEDLLNFISDGTGGPITVESIPKNKSVTENKTTFITPKFVDYVDSSAVEEDCYYNSANGAKINTTDFDTIVFSELEVGQSYTGYHFYSDTTPSSNTHITFWDSAGTFISGINANTFVVPANTAVVKRAFRKTVTKKPMLTITGAEILYKMDNIETDLNYSKGKVDRSKTSWYDPTTVINNLYDRSDFISGHYYATNGIKTTSSTFGTTPKLHLKKSTIYKKEWFSNQGITAGAFVTFWNDDGTEDGVFVSGLAATAEFTTPEVFDFVRLSVHKDVNYLAKLYEKNDPYKVMDNRLIIYPSNLSDDFSIGLSPLNGKKINVLSDSLGSTDYTRPNWWELIASETGATFNNYAESSTSLAHQPSTHGIRNGCMVERYVNMDKSADGVILMGTTNDNNVPVGLWDSTNIADIFGALNVLFEGLLNDYAGKPIIVMTPIQPATDYLTNVPDAKSALLAKAPTDTLSRQLRAEAIKLKCNQYGITCIDLYNESGINGADANRVYYRPSDTLHQSALGQKTMKNMIKPVLVNKFD